MNLLTKRRKFLLRYRLPFRYGTDGSIQVGDGDGTNAAQLWTNPGEYAFSSQPFSVTFRLNGLPPENEAVRKDSYFFLNERGSSKTLWFNLLVAGGEVNGRTAKLNVNIKDADFMADNFVLDFDFTQAESTSITLTYDSAAKTASIEYGSYSHEFDLTKNSVGGDFAKVEELPTGEIELGLMNTRGGVIIEQINGQSFRYTPPDLGFDTTPNFDDDIFTNTENTATVEYKDEGAHITNGDKESATISLASVNPKYKFDEVVDVVFRFDALQPAVAASQKCLYFTLFNDQDTTVQLVVKLFVYCTTDSFDTAQYILHADIFTGAEGSDATYFARSKNFLWDVKDFANTPIRVKYDAQAKQVRLFRGDARVDIDLTVDADGNPVTAQLPSGEMRFQTLVQYGGIYVESVNQHLLKFARSDYEVSYTDKKDFFTDESDARVAYRNEGILISNNDKTNVNYMTAKANESYVYDTGNMIFEFKFDSLQTYVPSIPLSVMKAVWFYIEDEEGNGIGLQPFLYQSGSARLMHVNISYDGRNIYENYNLGFDFRNYEQVVLYLKYDGNNHTLDIGSTTAKTTLDLTQSYNGTISQGKVDTSSMPSGKIHLDTVMVQFGGIYLRRINNYSFVVENPTEPDPVDPQVTDFDLEEVTFDKSVTIEPVIDLGGFPETEFKLSVRLPDGESDEFTALTAQDGVYTYEFGDYGVYQFKYELVFEGVTITAVRNCEYRSASINSFEELYTVNNGMYTVTEEGLMFTSPNVENNLMVNGIGKFEVSGTTSVKLNLVELQAPATDATPVYKEMWIDFTDGKNGVWVNVFAFNSTSTNGRYPAYASVFTFKNGDKGTQLKIQDNVPLNFNFDLSSGEPDPSAVVEIVYEPSAKCVSVGKVGEIMTSFDLIGRDLPTGKFTINTSVNYGSMVLTEIDGFSFAASDGEIEFPDPMISEDSVPTYLVIGEKLQVPKDVVFDIFDLKPTLEVSLKDADGQEITLSEEVIDGREYYSVSIAERGAYELTLKASNTHGGSTEKTFTVQVIPEDKEAPVMTFADDAFAAYRKGDRDYKYEVKKGTVIELPEPQLTDDSGLPVTLKVSVTDPKGNISLVNGMKFTGDTIGTYRVEYLATDVSGKETAQIVQFIVKLNWTEEEEEELPTVSGGCSGSLMAFGIVQGAAMVLGATAVILRKKKSTK